MIGRVGGKGWFSQETREPSPRRDRRESKWSNRDNVDVGEIDLTGLDS